MWFDAHAKLAEISGKPAATIATSATNPPRVAGVASVASPRPPEITPEELARDIFAERAAIREFDGGQSRPEAERDAWPEARQAAGITFLSEWRAEADDVTNPDVWK